MRAPRSCALFPARHVRMLALVLAPVQVGVAAPVPSHTRAAGTCAQPGGTERHQGRVCADTARFDGPRTWNILAMACFESMVPHRSEKAAPATSPGGMFGFGLALLC